MILLLFYKAVEEIKINFLNEDIFKINSVEIEGAENQLYEKLKKIEGSLINKNINFIDLKLLSDEILEDKRIEDVSIVKNKINSLKINIEEKEIEYYLQYKKEMYLLDKNGEICGKINEKRLLDIPIIYVKSKEEILPLIVLMKNLEKSRLKRIVSQAYIENKNSMKIVLLDGTIIKTNLEVDPEKYYVAEYLYFDLSKEKKIEYIDVRFKDYVLKYYGG